METYPLEQLDLTAAKALQFRLVETIARHFEDSSIFQAGDYGLWADVGRPRHTARVEAVLADFLARRMPVSFGEQVRERSAPS